MTNKELWQELSTRKAVKARIPSKALEDDEI